MSGMYRFKTDLAAATNRFANCGDTRTECLLRTPQGKKKRYVRTVRGRLRLACPKERRTHAMPRIFEIRPVLVKSNPDLIARTEGQVKVISPPPAGGCPRFVICAITHKGYQLAFDPNLPC